MILFCSFWVRNSWMFPLDPNRVARFRYLFLMITQEQKPEVPPVAHNRW